MEEEFNSKITDYGDHRKIVKRATNRTKPPSGYKLSADEISARLAARRNSTKTAEQKAMEQMPRIRRKLFDLAMTNDFYWFGTLTLDQKKVKSRSDYQEVKRTFNMWNATQRKNRGKFDFIAVPEFHKDGAIHFHTLQGDSNLDFVHAVNNKKSSKYYGQPLVRNGREIFNLTNWKYGHSDFEKIESREAAANYCTKYMTKGLMTNPIMDGKPKYFRSRGLREPDVSYQMMDDDYFDKMSPSFGLVDLDENGNSFLDLAIYKQEIDHETGEIINLPGDSLIRLKNDDTKTPPSETFDGSGDGFSL